MKEFTRIPLPEGFAWRGDATALAAVLCLQEHIEAMPYSGPAEILVNMVDGFICLSLPDDAVEEVISRMVARTLFTAEAILEGE